MDKTKLPPLSDQFLREIGLITAYWSALEIQLELAILEYQEIDPSVGLVITSHLGGSAKIELLRTFNYEGAFEPKSTKKDVNLLFDSVLEAYKRRNEVAHHLWVATEDPEVAKRKSVEARGKLRVIDERVHISDLRSIAKKIRDVGDKMTEFMVLQDLAPNI